MKRNVKEHLDFIIDSINKIEYNKAIILTGPNGNGKSLVRKLMSSKLKLDNVKYKVSQVSMQLRTTGGMMSGIGAFVTDSDWDPTSVHTYHLINQLINAQLNNEDCEKTRYIILDEPEIGMSRESQLAIALYIKDNLKALLNKTLGVMVITHSEIIVDILKDDCDFMNLDMDNVSMTADEWINRDIKPTNFEELSKWSHELFLEVANRNKEQRK